MDKIRWWLEDFAYHHKKLWWLRGFKVCYAEHPGSIGAFCKRRSYHLGEHRTGWACTRKGRRLREGVRWSNKLHIGHTPGNCRCKTYHKLTDC